MEQSEVLLSATLRAGTAHDAPPDAAFSTSDPTIIGTVTSRDRVHKLRARFHGSPAYVDITSVLSASGDFHIDVRELERIWDDRLVDGPYALRLQALDNLGDTLASTDVAFTLDTTPPHPVLFEPQDGGLTTLQLGFVDVALVDASGVDTRSVRPSNVVIHNGRRALRVLRAEPTSDGLFRYYYEGKLRDGPVKVSILQGQVADIAGNLNTEQEFTFEFTSEETQFNGIPQRSHRLQVEPLVNPPYNEDSGASVYLHSGEAFLRRVDLEIPGRGFDFRFERTYRSAWLSRPLSVPHTALGHKWDFNYNRRLRVVSAGHVVRMDGRGREDVFRSTSAAVAGKEPYLSPPGSYATLVWKGGRFVERDRHGNRITYEFQGDLGTYQMTRFKDRNGNGMLFRYGNGQLQSVIDTLGRTIELEYDGKLLVKVQDFVGREVVFSYDAHQRLVAVTCPRVVGTPHGNDFPKGKTERYTYENGTHNVFLTHNLLTVTAPNEVAKGGPAREVYVYNDDGRVVEHTFGGTNYTGVPAGGAFKYGYLYQSPLIPRALEARAAAPPGSLVGHSGDIPPAESGASSVRGLFPGAGDWQVGDLHGEVIQSEIPTTYVTDRNGNRTTYLFNPLGNWSEVREATNRDVRPSDPHVFVEHHQYDKDGQRLTVRYHEGNLIEHEFPAESDDPFQRLQQGNVLKVTRRPGTRGAAQSRLTTKYTYEPIYNQPRKVTDPRGNTTVYTFDYQEGSDYARLAARLGTTPEKVKALLVAADVPMGQGDVNGDGRTDQIKGNVVRIQHPTVNLDPDSNQAELEGATQQEIDELFAYNDFGQLIRHTDPEGNVTTYDYYPEWDPGGSGIADSVLATTPPTGGYLRRVTRDVTSDPRRNSGTNPPPASITTTYKYDAAGNVIRKIDGRGTATEYVVNELNQVVQVIRDAGDVSPSPGEPVISGEPSRKGFRYIERFWYDFNNNLVLHQKEDRGNTSNVKGNPPGLQELPIPAVMIDFGSVSEASLKAWNEKGFVLAARQGASDSAPTDSVPEYLEFVTARDERGLKLSSRLGSEGVELRREDGTPFTLESITILKLDRGDGQWVVVSPDGDREVLGDPETTRFSSTAWTNVSSIRLFPTGQPGDLVLGGLGVHPNPDPPGGSTAFADTVYKYDILDNRIETMQEVQNGASPHFLRTRYRYDANANPVLTIFPEGNASTVVYDERDLRFRQGHGERTPEMYAIESGSVFSVSPDPTLLVTSRSGAVNQWAEHFVRITGGKGQGQLRKIAGNRGPASAPDRGNILEVDPAWDDPPDTTSTYEIGKTFALLHPDDPIDYDVRGGLSCSCASYAYDGNRNLVEMVDASDTDLSPDNNNPELGPGDRTRYVYDGFDRLIRTIDSVGNQTVYAYDAASNRIREMHFGPTGGPSPTSDEPNTNLLATTTYRYDELNRQIQTDQDLFVKTIPTVRTPDVAEGAVDLGKGDLTPGDNQVSTRFEYDRKSRQTFTLEDDGDTFRTLYDGVDRMIKTVDPEGNTVEPSYDSNHNLIEVRQIEIAQESTSGTGILQNGQSTGPNDTRTLNDPTQSWRRFEWAGRTLRITSGTGTGQTRRIIDNTSAQLVVDNDWDVIPDPTSTYAILAMPLLESGQSTGSNTTETLNDATTAWAVGEWSGKTVEITNGAGAGQVRRITNNNPFQIFVDPVWDVTPDNTSQYAIYPRPQPGIAEVFLTTYFYDSLDRLERQIDNLGQTTYYRYDSRDNLVAMADAQGPAGGTITRRAFSNGQLTVNTINGFGNVTLYHYDAINRQTRQETILTASGSGDGVHIGATIEGIKNDASGPQSSPPEPDATQGGGDGIIRIGTLYDDNSLVSANIDDQGNITLYLYDNLDRRVTEIKGLTTGAGPLTKALILGDREIPTPDMATIDDPSVISTAKINAQLAAAEARIDTVAPLFPSLADQVNDPPTTVYGYDPESNLLILEDGNGSRVYMRYDAIRRPIAVRVFRAGQADSHAGDPVFAPQPASAPASPGNGSQPAIGTTRQDFQYDGLSRLVMAADNNDPAGDSDDSLVTLAYDSLGRVLEEQQKLGGLAPGIISAGWRAENLRSALTFPNNRAIGYTYDGLNRLKTIADDGATQSLVQYNYVGPARVLERRYPINDTRMTHLDDNGSHDIGYDGLQRPIKLRHLHRDNSPVVGFVHTYDRANNKLIEEKLHAPGDSELYRYDSLYRLVQFERGALNAAKDAIDAPSTNVPQHAMWRLDGAGNWTDVDGEAREHSSLNEITSRNAAGRTPVTLDYDKNGNLTYDGNRTFEWDTFNRLRRVRRQSDGQLIAEYAYDALGRRTRKTVTNSGPLDGSTFYYYDGQRVIEEQDGTEPRTQQYVYGIYIDEVLVMDRNLDGDRSGTGPGDQRIFYHQNALTHVYALTNAAGGIVEGYLYDGYGQHAVYRAGDSGIVDFGGNDTVLANEPSDLANPYLFTGRRLDAETGAFYYRARYLRPDLGRFVSQEPLGLWTNVGNLGNAYTYVAGNPIMWVDPLGLEWGPWQEHDRVYNSDIGGWCVTYVRFWGEGNSGTGSFRNEEGNEVITIEGKHPEVVTICDPEGPFTDDSFSLIPNPEPIPPEPVPGSGKERQSKPSRKEERYRRCVQDHETKLKQRLRECGHSSTAGDRPGYGMVGGATGGMIVGSRVGFWKSIYQTGLQTSVRGCAVGLLKGCAAGAVMGVAWALGSATAGGVIGWIAGRSDYALLSRSKVDCIEDAFERFSQDVRRECQRG